jgi:drug/metabolite transporter (DMT)-like permease
MTEALIPGLAGLSPGPAAALAAAMIWAFTSILFTAAGRNVVPVATNLFKTAAATLFFAVGIVGLGIGDSFLFAGYQLLGTRRAMLVQSTHPLFGTILAVVFFAEWPSALQFLGIAVVLGGVALVLGDSHHRRRVVDPARRRRGIVFCLIAAIGQATGAMLAKEALVGVDAFGATQVRVAGGAVALAIFGLLRGELGGWIRGLLQREVLWRVTAASVLGPFIAVFLMLYSIQNAPAGVALTLLATAPVWLLPLGAIFQKDHPSRQESAGVLLALAGIAVLLR